MKQENKERRWFIRFRWFRCTATAGQLLIWAQNDSEARAEAAERLGVPPEALDVQSCPAMEEKFQFLCFATERELENGDPRKRRK